MFHKLGTNSIPENEKTSLITAIATIGEWRPAAFPSRSLSGRPSNKSAFANCGLTSFTLPVSVNDFGDYIFIDCYQLTNVIISPGVLTLRETMFSFCNALQSLSIPDSVTNIDTWVFAGCANLTHIDVSPGNPAYSSINGVVFKKNQTTLLSFPSGFSGNYAIPVGVTNIGDSAFLDCVGVTNITIPNGVTRIGIELFADCYDLANISIPSSVTYIGDSAFYPDYELTSVYFQGNAPQIGTSIFGASDSGIDNSTVYYLPGATGWGTAFGGLPTALWLPQIFPRRRINSGSISAGPPPKPSSWRPAPISSTPSGHRLRPLLSRAVQPISAIPHRQIVRDGSIASVHSSISGS